MILVIDNYDSFVHNLARYFRRLGQTAFVVRNDQVTARMVEELSPSAIVLSPGPGTPESAGRSIEIVRQFADSRPMLGVCLGHQTIASAFGGRTVRAIEPVHGRASPIHHSAKGIFKGLPSPFLVGRYHSLVVEPETLPACFRPLAHTADGVLMALEHESLPLVGLQFHPESVLTDYGYDLLSGFLRQAGLVPSPVADPSECVVRGVASTNSAWPQDPITF